MSHDLNSQCNERHDNLSNLLLISTLGTTCFPNYIVWNPTKESKDTQHRTKSLLIFISMVDIAFRLEEVTITYSTNFLYSGPHLLFDIAIWFDTPERNKVIPNGCHKNVYGSINCNLHWVANVKVKLDAYSTAQRRYQLMHE